MGLHVIFNRISRTERSGRYGSDQPHDDPEWYDRRDRDQDRDNNMRRCNDERRGDRFEDRRGSRDSPEVVTAISTVLGSLTFITLINQLNVLSKEKENDGTAIDQKMDITLMGTTQSRITDGNLERRRRARPSCSGVCPLMPQKMTWVFTSLSLG